MRGMTRHTKPLMVVVLLMIMALSIYFKPDAVSGAGAAPMTGSHMKNAGVGEWFLSFYRDHISPVDGDRCPSYPSCASFSVKAIKKHGFFMGWIMTVDRLIHEGREEAKVSPVAFSEGKWKIYDPVENNDFWWYKKNGKNHD